jgi:deazaflavin-dependent oxidoreductase (nitroreductase family)
MAIHVLVYRLTRGVLGSRMAGQSVLLLHTIGRKSGKNRITPINYFRDGERFVVVASNWGRSNNPAWYINLQNQPAVTIQVKSEVIKVRPEDATRAEYQRLWKLVTGKNDYYVRYQKQTQRTIPIVILIPEKLGRRKSTRGNSNKEK